MQNIMKQRLLCLFARLNAILFFVVFFNLVAFGQFCLDGNYCPNPSVDASGTGNGCFPGIDDEYGDAETVILSQGLSTCHVNQVWGKLALDSAGDYNIYFAIHHGNSGQSSFRTYVNTDCDSLTGQLFAPGNFGDVCPPVGPGDTCIATGGADYMIEFNTAGANTVTWFIWDTTTQDMIVDPSFGSGSGILTGAIGGCAGSDGEFVEIEIPLISTFDPCTPDGCGNIEITTIVSNAGGSSNSNFCEGVGLKLDIPINDPPIAIIAPLPPCTYSDAAVCLDGGPSIDINGDTLTYEWDLDYDGMIFNTDTVGEVICLVLAPDTYTVALRVTDIFNCSDTTNDASSLTFEIFDSSNKVTCAVSNTQDVICSGDLNGSFDLTITGGFPGYNYYVTNTVGDTIASGIDVDGSLTAVVGLDTDTYTVFVNDTNLCLDTCMVTIFGPTPVVCTINGSTNETCNDTNDGTISISGSGGTGPYIYDAGGGLTNNDGQFTGLTSNTYSITITDAIGCLTTCGDVFVSQPDPLSCTVNGSTNESCFEIGDGTIDVSASGGTSPYIYDIGGGVTNTDGQFSGLSASMYSITITDANGCN